MTAPGAATIGAAAATSSGCGTTSRYAQGSQSEFVAVILAATVGTRLFPLTDLVEGIPKHLLPVAGAPILKRLLMQLYSSGFVECVVAIAHEDYQTLEFLQHEITKQQPQQQDKSLSLITWRETKLLSPPSLSSISAAAAAAPGIPTSPSADAAAPDGHAAVPDFMAASTAMTLEIGGRLKVTVVRLGEECEGSVGAINQIEAIQVASPKSNLVVIPGDLVLLPDVTATVSLATNDNDATAAAAATLTANAFAELVHTHRQKLSSLDPPAACTILLNDSGEQDENGVPLKESAKQKMGGLARDEDDMEYIALSYPSPSLAAAATTNTGTTTGHPLRVVWKQNKLEAEEDKHMTGATPKLQLPKPRLRLGQGVTRVRSDWTDVHVYVLSPWVRRLLWLRNYGSERSQQQQQQQQLPMISLADDLLPLLIARQFLSIRETFGSHMDPLQVEEMLKSLESNSSSISSSSRHHHHHQQQQQHNFMISATHTELPSGSQLITPSTLLERSLAGSTFSTSGAGAVVAKSSSPYSVLAHVQKSAFRSSTVPAYLYVSKEMVGRALSGAASSSFILMLPPHSNLKHKFSTILLPDCKVGDKVTFKSTVVGRNCTLGNKCRLNNCIVMDNVTLGDNCSLQNTVIGKGAVVGDNCSLNDCQVAPGKKVPAGTKAKSEALTDDEHHGAGEMEMND